MTDENEVIRTFPSIAFTQSQTPLIRGLRIPLGTSSKCLCSLIAVPVSSYDLIAVQRAPSRSAFLYACQTSLGRFHPDRPPDYDINCGSDELSWEQHQNTLHDPNISQACPVW